MFFCTKFTDFVKDVKHTQNQSNFNNSTTCCTNACLLDVIILLKKNYVKKGHNSKTIAKGHYPKYHAENGLMTHFLATI